MAYRIKAVEDSLARERLDNKHQRNYIDNLSARLANNNADLFFVLQENITDLEDSNEMLSWNEWSQKMKIRRLEELVDSSNISWLEESIRGERKISNRLRDKICSLASELGQLQAQIRDMQASHPVEETAGDRYNYASDDDTLLFLSVMTIGVLKTSTMMPPSMMASPSWTR